MEKKKRSSNPDGVPEDARRVFRGVIFDVWQWKQTMYDGTRATFEKIARVDTAVVIPTVGNKILIEVQEQPDRQKPFVSLPAGRCEPGERPLESAQRELEEETGYTSTDWTLWKEDRPHGKILWTIYHFIARNSTLTSAPHLDAGERISTKLVTFDEFLMLSDEPTFRDRDLLEILLRARLNKKTRAELRATLFKKP